LSVVKQCLRSDKTGTSNPAKQNRPIYSVTWNMEGQCEKRSAHI